MTGSYHGSTDYEHLTIETNVIGTYILEIYGYSTRGSTYYWGEYILTPYEVTICFDISPKITTMEIDNVQYSGFPRTFTWDYESRHTFKVESIVQTSDDTRYVFRRWTDGITSNSRSLWFTSDERYTAYYDKQYYLTVVSDLGNPTGEGWYNEGSVASFSVDSQDVSVLGIKYIFDHWEGTSVQTSVGSIRMYSPNTVRAVWAVDPSSLLIIAAVGAVALFGVYKGYKAIKQKRQPPSERKASISKPRETKQRVKPVVKSIKPLISHSETDKRVLAYIIKNKGAISISKAVAELNITTDELNASFTRLKKQGKIK